MEAIPDHAILHCFELFLTSATCADGVEGVRREADKGKPFPMIWLPPLLTFPNEAVSVVAARAPTTVVLLVSSDVVGWVFLIRFLPLVEVLASERGDTAERLLV